MQGIHIAAVGADLPHRRELSTGVYSCADKLVTDLPNQAYQTGEINDAVAVGAINKTGFHATLGDIVAGKICGRERDDENTIFKSTGMAIQDIAAAKRVYEAALETGMGVEVAINP